MLKSIMVFVLALTLASHAQAQQSLNDCARPVTPCANKLAEGGSIDAMRFLQAMAPMEGLC